MRCIVINKTDPSVVAHARIKTKPYCLMFPLLAYFFVVYANEIGLELSSSGTYMKQTFMMKLSFIMKNLCVVIIICQEYYEWNMLHNLSETYLVLFQYLCEFAQPKYSNHNTLIVSDLYEISLLRKVSMIYYAVYNIIRLQF